jgi:hypothetical protein
MGLMVIFVIWLAVLLFHGRALRGDVVHIAGRRVTFHQCLCTVRPTVGAAYHIAVHPDEHMARRVSHSSPLDHPRSPPALIHLRSNYNVLAILNEVCLMWYYVISAILFIISRLDYYLLRVICRVSFVCFTGSPPLFFGLRAGVGVHARDYGFGRI